MASIDQGASQRRYNEGLGTPLGGTTSPVGGAGESYGGPSAGLLDAHDSGSSKLTAFTAKAGFLDAHDTAARSGRTNESLKTRIGTGVVETGQSGDYVGAKLTVPTPLFPLVTWYLLRAYDVTCVTPTFVTWISTTVDLSRAPAPPCGGTFGPIAVLMTWKAPFQIT